MPSILSVDRTAGKSGAFMNTSIRHSAAIATLLLAAGFAAGCSKTEAPTPVMVQPAAAASDTAAQPSLVGTVPAGPTKDAPSTASAAKTDISKAQQSNDMPMPGQANDHSTLAPNATQKANTNGR
jgi:hypothetical protein